MLCQDDGGTRVRKALEFQEVLGVGPDYKIRLCSCRRLRVMLSETKKPMESNLQPSEKILACTAKTPDRTIVGELDSTGRKEDK